MKNIIKISMIVCFGLFSQMASANGWNTDTLKVIQANGDMLTIILNNIQDKEEVKAKAQELYEIYVNLLIE
jgi:hypothetical protein